MRLVITFFRCSDPVVFHGVCLYEFLKQTITEVGVLRLLLLFCAGVYVLLHSSKVLLLAVLIFLNLRNLLAD